MKILSLTSFLLCFIYLSCSQSNIIEKNGFEGTYNFTDITWGGSCTTPQKQFSDGKWRNIDWKQSTENGKLIISKIDDKSFEIIGLMGFLKSKVIAIIDKDVLTIVEQPIYKETIKSFDEVGRMKELPIQIQKVASDKIQVNYNFTQNYSCSEHNITAIFLK